MKEFKECKGINSKTRGFESCGQEVLSRTRRYGLCPFCYKKWLLGTPQGVKHIKKVTLQVKDKAENRRQKIVKEMRALENEIRISTLLKNLRTIFHKYIRTRDKGKPCISCGQEWNITFHAGHYKKAELYSSLRFHEHNVNGQCVHCNIRLEGNEDNYRSGLERRYGKQVVEEINFLADEYKKNTFHWDAEELKQLQQEYSKKLKYINNN